MKRHLPFIILLLLVVTQATAQQAVLNKQRHFPKTVPAGNYSGIAWLGDNRYAIANDKSPTAGFHLMTIRINDKTGQIENVREDRFVTNNQPNRDEEGICYVPQHNTVFVSSESDGNIVEYTMDGQLTGRKLNIPVVLSDIHDNRGFEALTYNATTHRFWTTTENTLKTDGKKPSLERKMRNLLRLQSFGDDLQPKEQYWYLTDSLGASGTEGKSTLGVSGLAALDDGQVVVLEREVRHTEKNIGSYVQVKLYVVHPSKQQAGELLQKQLLTEFSTRINLTNRSFANYEGLCAGPRLTDGRQVLLLIADSQNQYKGYLKDWFRTVVLPDVCFIPNPSATTDIKEVMSVIKTSIENPLDMDIKGFLSKEEYPDHTQYLLAPPVEDSETFQSDIFYYQWGKSQRNTPRGLQAAIDEAIWISKAFGPTAGIIIGPKKTPEIFKLVEGALVDARAINRKAKETYQRIRPLVHFDEPSLTPEEDDYYSRSFSYPSGHTLRGWVYAMTLAQVVPDSTDALIRRAQEFALNRVICGHHYKSDTDASLIEATAIMSRLNANAAFQRQLAKARKEYARIKGL